MRILFIAPSTVRIKYNISGVYPLPPLGLAYIASILEKNDFFVEILDMPALKMDLENLYFYLKNNKHSIYGLSCNVFNLRNGIKISQLIKKVNPEAKIVLGGRCTAFPPEVIFRYGPDFDIIVQGEGEQTMLKLCLSLRDKKKIENLGEICGISYRDNNKIITTPSPPYYTDLDDLPFPARHLLPNRYYRMHPPSGIYSSATLMETSRGCAYNCNFCTLPGPIRMRSIPSIIEEFKEVINKFRTKEVHFIDPNFTYSQKRIIELCNQILENNIKIAWTCKTRVDLVSRDLLKTMFKAGCYMISYGVETGSQKILDSLNKGIKVRDIENSFSLTKECKIRALAYILLGAPGENNSTVEESMDLVERIKPDFVLYGRLLPDPNSVLTKQAINKKQISYEDLADFYIFNRKNTLDKVTLTGIPVKNINRWLSAANKSFYFRLSYIFQRLKDLKNVQDLLNLVKGSYLLLLDKVKPNQLVK